MTSGVQHPGLQDIDTTGYAGFWPRLGAGLVDLVILSPIIAILIGAMKLGEWWL